MFRAVARGEINALWIIGTNPAAVSLRRFEARWYGYAVSAGDLRPASE